MTPLTQLRKIAESFGPQIVKLANHVIDHPLFPLWTGSGHSFVHHYGRGQLLQHTLEVVQISMMNNEYFTALGKGVDPKLLFCAALFHDIGKIYDYAPIPPYTSQSGEKIDAYQEWTNTKDKTRVYHITRSVLAWTKAFEESGAFLSTEEYEQVLHGILAHHGKHEYKSPAEPQDRLAWLLHLSDNMSARIDDCVKERPWRK